MRLKLSQRDQNHHTDMVTAVCWTPGNELFTASDDKTIARWNMDGELIEKVCDLDTFVTDIHWFPSIGKQAPDTFAISCTDGSFRLMSKSGREEKKVAAHEGAVVSLRWNHDGSALVTAGEDGAVKVWSRSGMHRSTLIKAGTSVYSVCWAPDNDAMVFSQGSDLIIKALQVGRKQLKWRAHDGVVLKVDWNPVNQMLVSGGEDRKYKVWDCYGRPLFASAPLDHVITSVSWAPNGALFGVGSLNVLRMCDKTGWAYSRDKPSSGSIMSIAWTADGTQLGSGGGNGAVVLGSLVDRQLEWHSIEVRLTDSKEIRVTDVVNEMSELLDFRDRVIDLSLGFEHLVVATACQCFVYSVSNFNTPHIFDVRDSVNLILQSATHFATVDKTNGVQVYSYDGRLICSPRFAGMRVEFLNHETLSMNYQHVAILDRATNKTIRVFNAKTGAKASDQGMSHNLDIVEMSLSQYEGEANDYIAFIDKNHDLYITPVRTFKPFKLHTMVVSMCWSSDSNMLTALADGKLVTWYFPMVVFVDKDLLPLTTVSQEGSVYGKNARVISFSGSRISVRRGDGAQLHACISPYPAFMYGYVGAAQWDEAVRLCRYVKSDELYAMLAGMSLAGRHLDTAEVALAAVKEVDKLQYILYIKDIPSEEGQAAELALYNRSPEEAERILMQANPPLVYRAIKLNIRLFRWHRALELAVDNRTHVDTVLAYRQRHLQMFGRKETDARFIQYAEQVTIDWEAIQAKKAQEKEKEEARAEEE